MGIARGWEKRVIRTNITYAKRTVRIFSVSPQSRSVFSLIPDLLFDCSRVLEYAKIRTVLQSREGLMQMGRYHFQILWTLPFQFLQDIFLKKQQEAKSKL